MCQNDSFSWWNWEASTGGSDVLSILETSAHILLNQSCFSAIAFCTFSTSAASRWLNFSSPALNESTAFWASCVLAKLVDGLGTVVELLASSSQPPLSFVAL